MATKGSGATRSGGDGIHNEDAFVALEGLGLYVVSDGVSECPAGEVASGILAKALEEYVRGARTEAPARTREEFDAIAERGMAHSLRTLREAVDADPGLEGMNASVTMLLTDGHRGVVGHRGDSRAYLIRRRRTAQLTTDEELTDEIETDASALEFQLFGIDLAPGDTIILCTDGAETVVENPALAKVAGDLSPRMLASRIVSDANRLHPDLDATVVAVRVGRESTRSTLELSARPRMTAFGHALSPVSPAEPLPEDEPETKKQLN